MTTQGCPSCGKPVDEMVPVDTGMKVALTASGIQGAIPSFVCRDCYGGLTGRVSQGLRLRLEKDQRDKNKLILWKSRVNLIKQARGLMNQKAYSEAAVAYEKYLRVLEMVYNLKRGELSPEVFNNSKRSKELTVVASVYWDLVRIYDTSPRYGDRMSLAARKLAQFLPLSPIFPDVIKKAEAFVRTAKNPNVLRSFLKACKIGRARCFIATAVFKDRECMEIEALRSYRDQVLLLSPRGRQFVLWYYRHSPPIAAWIDSHAWAQASLRPVFRLVALAAKKNLNSGPGSFNS